MDLIPVGETALVISVSGEKTGDCVRKVGSITKYLQGKLPGDLVSIRSGLDAVLLEFESKIDLKEWQEKLSELEESPLEELSNQEFLRLPVCYENEFGRDLDRVAGYAGLSFDEIIQMHSSVVYDVWMIGFMPGFPYLGPLPEALQIERKTSPDPMIPSGSVAVADEFSGIYPFDSPGGWHVIGRTPVTLVDYSRTTPWLMKQGMKVQFYPVTSEEYGRIMQS